VLTYAGMKEKLKIPRQYLLRRKQEYEKIQKEIAQLHEEVHVQEQLS
jgi:hypothetical protein